MTSAQQLSTLAGANCPIAFDNLTRQLYATDASIYQIEPVGVAFPRNARQASSLIEAAAQAGVSVIPRGAGTGLVGGAIGDGLVIDFSRHNLEITELDLERRSVRVGPGVVLDHLNNLLRPHGFCFGPDVATSSRATLGGMIANNSSGAHTPVYGTTADHVSELEIVLADGRIQEVGPGHDTLHKQRELVSALVYFHALEIAERLAPGLSKRQREFAAARDLLELDHKPCQSILVVEFFEEVGERLAALTKRRLGLRRTILKTPAEANLVWSLRRAGLSLLTGRQGDAKPVTGIEDTAVNPEQLPAYVAGLESLMAPLGLEVCYYGHAAAGLLHVRPVLDLRSAEDLRKFRQLANEVSALVSQFQGSLAGEHGVGIARTEFMPQQLGDGLLEVMREVKAAFDPHNLFNPGKLVPDGRFEIDTNLRLGAGYELKLPFEPVLAFAAKDESFVRNLEQCNGCGGCRKETP